MKYKLDILHVQSFGFIVADLAVVLKKIFTKTKIVNTPHGPFMALKKYPWWQEVLKRAYRIIESPINGLYDAVIQVNPEQWRWIIECGVKKERIHFIPSSIPDELFKRVSTKSFTRKYKLHGKFVISYIGRIQRYKGLDQVIEVLPDLLKYNPNIIFLAMGNDAGDMERLKELARALNIENHVIFTGPVTEKEKLQGLSISCIYVLPSEWEAFGTSLIEAMARGNALVSTKTEGGKFLIQDGVNGFLYDYKDTKQLKEKLLKLIRSARLRRKIINNNIKKVREYSIREVVKKLENLYLSLIN